MSCDGLSVNSVVNSYKPPIHDWYYKFGYGTPDHSKCIPMNNSGTYGTPAYDPNPKINYIWQNLPDFINVCSQNTTNTVSYTYTYIDPTTGNNVTATIPAVYCVWTDALPTSTDITATGITVPSGKTYKFFYGSSGSYLNPYGTEIKYNIYVTKIATQGTKVDVASFGLPSDFYCPHILSGSCTPNNKLYYIDITPTASPTYAPTAAPITASPTYAPTAAPITASPTYAPTAAPITASPTYAPTASPTMAPSPVPYSYAPTMAPITSAPITAAPTMAPITAAPFSYEPETGASTTDISGALKNGFIPGLNNTDSIIVLVVIIFLILAVIGISISLAKKYKKI